MRCFCQILVFGFRDILVNRDDSWKIKKIKIVKVKPNAIRLVFVLKTKLQNSYIECSRSATMK